MMTAIRRGRPDDLEAVAAIQYWSPQAAQWNPPDYLAYDFHVATIGDAVAGFLVARRTAPDECEILNLAVAPDHRRKGIAGRLVRAVLENPAGAIFLEVRESNSVARQFYKSLGFQEVARRPQYYDSPLESAIVMKFHSC